MKTQQPKIYPEVIVDIKSLSHEGRGIAYINDKATFVNGALPSETVNCKITKRHTRYNEGETLAVINASKDRVTPQCEHANICGGCSLQHMDMQAQIQFKEAALLEQLKHFGQVTPEIILPALSGNPYHYRRKARLGVRYVRKKERLLVGFREKSSSFLADIHACQVLDKSIGLRIEDLSKVIASLTQYEQIAQVEVAVSDTETALVFRHLEDLGTADIEKLCEFGKQFHFQIYLQPNAPAKIHKIFPEDGNERLSYRLDNYDLTLQFHPLDFTQINGEMNPLMVQQALALLDIQKTDSILDLFCGLGNFTLPIARSAKTVTGVEGSYEMVLRAKANAALNDIENSEFFAANLTEPNLTQSFMQKTYDKILLDPPRTGALEIIQQFPRLAANRVVYVSCNPATLARDAKELVHVQKYKLKASGIINMFPHTSHIEAMALFEK